MTWLWVLGIVALLLLWLCLTRVGAQAAIDGDSAVVDVRVGLLHFRVFPGKAHPKEGHEKKEKEPKKPRKEKDPSKKMAKPAPADILDAVKTLWPPLRRALGRTRRGIRIHPLSLRVTLGGEADPASAATLYGNLQMAIWNGMPQLEKLLDIPGPALHVGLDFDTPKTRVEGTVGVTIRVGTVLAVAFGVGIPALKWFLRFRKKQKKAAQAAGQQPATVPEEAENNGAA